MPGCRGQMPQCGVKTVAVPWARPGSGFTLLFEALVMTLVRQMPVRAASRIVGEHDTRLWRIVHHYVGAARAQADLSGVRRVGIDETASRRSHHYISVFVDLDRAKVVHVAPGKDGDTVARASPRILTAPWRSGVPSGGSLHRHVAGLSGGGAGASARGGSPSTNFT